MKMENEKERKICKETVKASNLGKHKKRIVNLFVRGSSVSKFTDLKKDRNFGMKCSELLRLIERKPLYRA